MTITVDIDGKIVYKGEMKKYIQVRKDGKLVYGKAV